MSFVKNAAVGAVFGGSLLFTAGLGIANAQPVQAPAPGGLVNLAVGNVTILQGVTAETAATTAGAICGSAPADVNGLATQVATDGADKTVCAGLPGGDLVLQNASLEQPDATEGTGPVAAPDGPVTAPHGAAAIAPSIGG